MATTPERSPMTTSNDQSVPMKIDESPEQQRLHQQRRRPITPIATPPEHQHPYTEEIELQQVETDDEAGRLSPLTQSASSTLRNDLARFQQHELRRYYGTTCHTGPSTSRGHQPLSPIYTDCYYPWQPPMAHPPTPAQPMEPAPELSRNQRR